MELVSVDILGPLPMTNDRNLFEIIITDIYSRLARAIRTAKATATYIVAIFLDKCVMPYLVPLNLLTNSRSKFVGKFFLTDDLSLKSKG